MKQLKLASGLVLAAAILTPFFAAYPACDPPPQIINTLPRRANGWSGSVVWYNDKIYEVADSTSDALIKNPVTGVTEGSIKFGSWAADDTKGFTYDPFRGTFWCKVGQYAYQVAVTGGNYISRFNCQRAGYTFGIWCDSDEENVMWVADPVDAQVRKLDMLTGNTLKIVNTGFNVRGVSRVGDTLWCVRAGEIGDRGVVIQVDMQGNELCKFYLPEGKYDHDAGGCDIDPEGYLWVHGGKETAIYQIDIGYDPSDSTYPILDSGDYDGDSTSDLAIFRPASGLWAVRGKTRTYFGMEDDIPASGDFNGDGTTDIAVFRPSSGLWAVKDGARTYFGAEGDIPVPGDYNGDGTVEGAIFRSSSGLWAVRAGERVYFGADGDIPVPHYTELGGSKQIAIFRPSNGLWAVRGGGRVYFGTDDDQPVIGSYQDPYDASPAIYRSASGLWAVRGVTRSYFGAPDDQPVPGNYTGFLPAEIGIFRSGNGLWSVQGVTRAYFGTEGDIAVSTFSINPSSAAVL